MKQILNIKSLLGKKVVKNGLWMLVLQTFNMIIPLLTIPYITRVLGSAGYGSFSVALNWVLYFMVIVEYGFNLNGARKVALDTSKENIQKLSNNILSARFILTIISLASLLIIWAITDGTLSSLYCMLLLFLMVLGTSFCLTWLFQGMQDMKFITLANVLARTISVACIFLFVSEPEHIFRYCLFYSCTYVISSIIGFYICRTKYDLKFCFSDLKSIINELKEGWFLFVSAAMICIFSNFGITVLGNSVSDSLVGAFAAIHKIPYVMSVLFIAVSRAIYPYISKGFAISPQEGIRKIKKTLLPVITGFSLIGVFLIFFKNIIVEIAFGDEYIAYSFLLIPFVFQFLFAVINNFIGVQSLVANGHSKEYSISISIGMLIIVISNIALIKYYGVGGAAYASLLSEAFLTMILIYMNKRIYFNKECHV